MSHYQNGQTYYPPPGNPQQPQAPPHAPDQPYQQLGAPDHTLRRTPSFNPGDDTGFADERRASDDAAFDQPAHQVANRPYRVGSLAGRQNDELFMQNQAPNHSVAQQPAQLPVRTASQQGPALSGYQHQYQPQSPPLNQPAYNPQHFPRPATQYSPQPYTSPNPNLGYSPPQQAYNPAAYHAQGTQRHSTYQSQPQPYAQAPSPYSPPAPFSPSQGGQYVAPAQQQQQQPQQAFGRTQSQYAQPHHIPQPTRQSTYSSAIPSQQQAAFSPPLPPPPGSAGILDRRPVYSAPAPPPPPFPPAGATGSSSDYQAPVFPASSSSDHAPTHHYHSQSPHSSVLGQPQMPSPPVYHQQDYFDSPPLRVNRASISPGSAVSSTLPSPPAPTPPEHGVNSGTPASRHPHSRPLPGPPVDNEAGGRAGRTLSGANVTRTEEELAQESIWREVEAAVMNPEPSANDNRSSPRIDVTHDSPVEQGRQPAPLFANGQSPGASPRAEEQTNGHLTATGTGQYVNYDAYDDESDAEAAAGLAAMREADAQEAATDARRDGAGPLFGTYGSQRRPEPQGPAELSSDSDYANVDMGSYGGGYGSQVAYGRGSGSSNSDARYPNDLENGARGPNSVGGPGVPSRAGTYDYAIPSQDAIHPFPSFSTAARVDTSGTGGLSEPSPHGRKQNFDETEELNWERRSGSESPAKDDFPEIFYHPGMNRASTDRPLPRVPSASDERMPYFVPAGTYRNDASSAAAYDSQDYPPAPNAYANNLLNPATSAVPRSTSLSSHSSTPQAMPPVRSKTDAEERKARLLRQQQYGGATYPPTPASDFGLDSPGQSAAMLDLPSIPAGKRKKFVPTKLSTSEFKRCTEPWALSSIAAWVRDLSEDETDLKEKTIMDGIVALFTHKVPTMNIADAETLGARVVNEMFAAGALVHEEEWVKFGDAEISGVMWQLTGQGCYSPRVHSQVVAGRCYSHHCSRTLKKINLQTQVLEPQRKLEDWATFFKLKKEDIEHASKKEIERQNILHEIVQTEDSYMDQLNVLRVLYRDQLLAWQPPLISQDRMERFARDVFGRVDPVKKVNEDFLLAQLKYRQQEQGPWIVGFSDIFREWIRKAKDAYMDYAASFPNAARIVRKEKENNLLFRQFLDHARDNERSKRLEWDTYLKAPITRLQRYGLLLSTVHKNMIQESEEKTNLQTAIDEIKLVTMECDTRVAEATQKVTLLDLGSKLILRPGMERVELNLNHLGRELIFKGDLQRTGANRFTWLETHAILFDHYLVLAKTVQVRDNVGGVKHERYDVSKLPIPMDLLVLESPNDDPVVKSSVKGIGAVTTVTTKAQTPAEARLGRAGTNLGTGPGTLAHTNTAASVTSVSTTASGKTMVTNTVLEGPKDEKVMYPFRVKHLGQDVYTLYAPSASNRQDWCDKILEAKQKHATSLFAQNAEPFRLRAIADTAFGSDVTPGGPRSITITGTPLDRAVREVENTFAHAHQRPGFLCRAPVNCSTAFTVSRPSGQTYGRQGPNGVGDYAYQKQMVAIGTDIGVFVSELENPRGWTKAITATRVTQIAVLEEFSLFLVIADKSLIAYHLDVVCPANDGPPRNDSARRAPQKLSGNREVGFFATGKMKDRMLVFYKKRDGLSSTFKALEPVFQKANEKKSRFSRKGNTEFFREFDEFYIPSECFGINVFRSYLAISTARGFEVLNLDKKQGWAVPDLKQQHVASIAARLSGQKPLGMFRLNDTEFLLCYEECAVYVNKHGDVSRSVIMEFVGKAKSAAMYEKYILLFDADFVEIRNAENGRLRQVIAGKDVKCLDDIQAGDSAGQRTIKIVLQHPEHDKTQLVVELILNEGQQE
ncbi:MAG: hypothetical protein M1825_001309 [Sarcosagium campestre]|nr:MAG: hypothetical protein M1825_001309 [Sarcosagium campestre]